MLAVGLAASLVLLGATSAAAAEPDQGLARQGREWAEVQLPAAALAEGYANAGYHLEVTGGVARVSVDLAPLASAQRFTLPAADREDAVLSLARSLTASSVTRYEATSRILSWVARNVRYDLDRTQPQDPAAVLARRSAYCTGIARVTVALLASVGIPAREVPGFVASRDGEPGGYHRWVEVRYDDRGWVFSDPSRYHHFVPPYYVRLASEALLPEPERDRGGLLRHVEASATYPFPAAPVGVVVRPNR